eukprot:3656719-Prymnesium_polylepis.1
MARVHGGQHGVEQRPRRLRGGGEGQQQPVKGGQVVDRLVGRAAEQPEKQRAHVRTLQRKPQHERAVAGDGAQQRHALLGLQQLGRVGEAAGEHARDGARVLRARGQLLDKGLE